MKHLSNEEKAKELCDCYSCKACVKFAEKGAAYALSSTCDRFDELMEAMQWKDEQFAKEKESFFKEYRKEILDACIYDFEQKKQQLIDKAADFISQKFYIGINNHVISKEDYYTFTELIRDFEQAMEGE